MYKIIFIDIDGTLRNDKKEITSRTKEAIQRIVEKGIQVVICSGRRRKYTEEVSKEALASKYVIVCNGGEIYDYEKKEVIYQNKLENETMITLYHMAEKYDVQLAINAEGDRIVKDPTNIPSNIMLQEPIEKFVKKNAITQCIFSSASLEKIKKIKEEVNLLENVEIANSSKCLVDSRLPQEQPFFLDIASKGTSKGNAIKKLCEHLKIDLEDTVAIGDSYNDLTMFEVVGHRVVMVNTPEDIKEVADEVTDTNNNDGVAKFLEKIYREYI